MILRCILPFNPTNPQIFITVVSTSFPQAGKEISLQPANKTKECGLHSHQACVFKLTFYAPTRFVQVLSRLCWKSRKVKDIRIVSLQGFRSSTKTQARVACSLEHDMIGSSESTVESIPPTCLAWQPGRMKYLGS